MRHHRQRRAQGGSLLSLEVPLAGSREPVGETLTEDDGLAAWHGQTCCAAAAPELHHYVQAALARLPAEDRQFCTALAHRPLTTLAVEGFGSRQAAAKDTGTIRFDDGDFTVVADLPKRVDWDQDRLAAMVERIRAAGDDPAQYVDIAFKVLERKYAAWPDAIRARFEPARTVRPGTLKVEIVPQGDDQ